MGDFVKTFKLRQHTPLIHFQHEQDGAALRATELKPKVDAWIIAGLTKDIPSGQERDKAVRAYMINTHPEWLVGGAKALHLALDYKLHISATVQDAYLVASAISKYTREEYDRQNVKYIAGAPYFADNEKIKNKLIDEARRGLMYKDIQLEIFCLHEDLMSAIENALPYIFSYNNFGTRQSKGFGGFSLESTSVEDFEDMLLEHTLYNQSLMYRFEGRFSPDLQKVFKKIDLEYKILKSGFAKDRSQMMEYFAEKGIEWEKPVIKKELVKNKGVPSKGDYSKDVKRKYIRALLGLAELYEFPQDREKIKIAYYGGDDKENGINRFRSPITFKVFDSNIYMLPENIPDEIYGRKFQFTNQRGEYIIIETPPLGTFDLNKFLENHVEDSWKYVGQ